MKQIELATFQDALNAGKLDKLPKGKQPGDRFGFRIGDEVRPFPKTFKQMLKVREFHFAREYVTGQVWAHYGVDSPF